MAKLICSFVTQSDPLIIINCLMFANDLLILSENKQGLQNSLNNLEEYCDTWQLTLNVNKTKTMILQNKNIKLEQSFVKYKDKNLINVLEYKFLGILIKCNGNFNHSSEEL